MAGSFLCGCRCPASSFPLGRCETLSPCRQAGTESKHLKCARSSLKGAQRHSRVLPDIQAQDRVALGLDHFHQGVVLIACSSGN